MRARKLGGAEVCARVEARNVEARHARPPEEESGYDPDGREDEQAGALR